MVVPTLAGLRGQVEVARGQLEEALLLARTLQSPQLKGRALLELVDLERLQHRRESALEYFEEAETIFREMGDSIRLGVLLCKRGLLEQDAGEPTDVYVSEARKLYQEANLEPDSRLGLALKELRPDEALP